MMKIRRVEWITATSEGDYRAKLRKSAPDRRGAIFCNIVETAGEYVARYESCDHCIIGEPGNTPRNAIDKLIHELETVP